MNPVQSGLSIPVECDGVRASGGVDNDGVAPRRALEEDIHAVTSFDQSNGWNRSGRRNRSGEFDKAGRQQSDSGNSQGGQSSDKTDDPRPFQRGRGQTPADVADRAETEEPSAASAAENALRGGPGTSVAQPTTAPSAAVVRLVRGMNGAVAGGEHIFGAESVLCSAVPWDYTSGSMDAGTPRI